MSNPAERRVRAAASPVFRRHLDLTRAVQTEVRKLQDSPPAQPASCAVLLDSSTDLMATLPPAAAVLDLTREIRSTLYTAIGHERQCELLWREALSTSLFAARIARVSGFAAGGACMAGLLHRAGEALALQAIGAAEQSLGATLDPGSRSRMVLPLQRGLAEAMLRAWQLPATVSTAVLGWRQMGELGAASGECTAVYFGHLLAVESLYPEFCLPGMADALGANLGFDASTIDQLRTQGVKARELILALG